MTLGEYLRDLRKATGLSQNGLAREAGVNVAYINRIENGRYVCPSRQIVLSLVLALRINRPEADRLLWLAGLATLEDWQTTARKAEAEVERLRKKLYLEEMMYCDPDWTGRTTDSTPPEDRYRSGNGQ